MKSVNVIKFLEMQEQINQQINQYGEADAQLVGEQEALGDQLTGDEINQLYIHFEDDGMEYEDVEDQVNW